MPLDEVHRQSQIIVKKLIEMPEYQKKQAYFRLPKHGEGSPNGDDSQGRVWQQQDNLYTKVCWEGYGNGEARING